MTKTFTVLKNHYGTVYIDKDDEGRPVVGLKNWNGDLKVRISPDLAALMIEELTNVVKHRIIDERDYS